MKELKNNMLYMTGANRMWHALQLFDVLSRRLTDLLILVRHHLNFNGTVGQCGRCFQQKTTCGCMCADFGLTI